MRVSEDLGETPQPDRGRAPPDPHRARPPGRLHVVGRASCPAREPLADCGRGQAQGSAAAGPRCLRTSPSRTGRRAIRRGRDSEGSGSKSSSATSRRPPPDDHAAARPRRHAAARAAEPAETAGPARDHVGRGGRRDRGRAVSHVFPRVLNRDLPRAVRAEGVWIEAADGKRYLDAAGGAIVVSVGHGDQTLVEAMTRQASKAAVRPRDGVHDDGARGLRRRRRDDPADGRRADLPGLRRERGRRDRDEARARVPPRARRGLPQGDHRSSGLVSREHVRRARRRWEGRAEATVRVVARTVLARRGRVRVPLPEPVAPRGLRARITRHGLAEAIGIAGPENVAAFIAEPVAGATLAAAVPSDDYWPAIVDVCRRHGVLVIADEVMTGFGRTGRWFGSDHWERSTRHPHGREGDDERIPAVRVRGVQRRGVRDR